MIHLLRLHADVELRHLPGTIWLLGASKHTTERRLASAVLTHHDQDLRVRELALFNGEMEVSQRLLQIRVAICTRSIDKVFLARLANAESQRLFTETQVLGWNVAVEEDIDAFTDGCREGDDTIHSRLAVQYTHKIGKVVQNGQIVLDNNNIVIWMEEAADHATSIQSLLDVQERRWLVEHVDVGFLNTDCADGETLQFTTREQLDISIE